VCRTVAVIQARTGSTRLPQKTLARVLGRPLLDLMLERVVRARTLDEVVLATTALARDDELVQIARRRGIAVFRGSEQDVLGRYAGAARGAGAEVVVRLTADCPLIDPAVIDLVVASRWMLDEHVDLVTNAPPHGRTYPDGMDVEVLSAPTLARIDELATDAEDREHVTRRLQRPPFRYRSIHLDPPAGDIRITVDYGHDLDLVRAIFEDLYPRDPRFGLGDVLAWLDDARRPREHQASGLRRSAPSSSGAVAAQQPEQQ
jgi:spore coat polysaccharide biosynthesis protein SpsF